MCVCAKCVCYACVGACVWSCVKRRFSRFSSADCQASVSSACIGHYKCCGKLSVCVFVSASALWQVACCCVYVLCSMLQVAALLRAALTHHNYAQLHTKNAATTANGAAAATAAEALQVKKLLLKNYTTNTNTHTHTQSSTYREHT